MSLASDSRRHADEWFDVAQRMPAQQRKGALKVAEAWFHLALDAVALEADDTRTQ